MTRTDAIAAGYPVDAIVNAFISNDVGESHQFEQHKDVIYIGANLEEGRSEDMFFENKEEWNKYKLDNGIK